MLLLPACFLFYLCLSHLDCFAKLYLVLYLSLNTYNYFAFGGWNLVLNHLNKDVFYFPF